MALKDEPFYPALEDADRGFLQMHGVTDLDIGPALTAIISKHREMQSRAGNPADFVKVPKAPDDAAWADVHKAIGVPESADKYDFSTVRDAAGNPAPSEFLDKFRQRAFDYKLPQHLAAQRAQAEYVASLSANVDARQRAEAAFSAADTQLRAEWGTDYALNEFRAKKAAENLGLPTSDMRALGEKADGGYAGFMKRMAALGIKLGEAQFHGGQPEERAGAMTPEMAKAKIEELKGDRAWFQKWSGGDREARELWTGLHRIATPSPFTGR